MNTGMRISLFGGAQEVGRSAIMINDGTRVMLDYGLMLGNRIEYPVSMPNVDALVLSHAHLDHSGSVPALFNEMGIPVFGTKPTNELSMLLLNDTLKISRRSRGSLNFHKRQLASFNRSFIEMEYGESESIKGIGLTIYDAAHIPGSAITLLEREGAGANRRVVYTGDFKLSRQELHNGAYVPESDILIMESTYASVEHPDRKALERRLIDDIKATLDNGGNALVPVFAVGRAQEVLSMLHRNGLSGMTYMDGMAREATRIIMDNPGFISNSDILEAAVDRVRPAGGTSGRDEALSEPSIILTTAGMLNGGPVLYYIERLNMNSHIFLTGYQVEGTNGRLLMDHKPLHIEHREVNVGVGFSYYDLSAHAGASELHEYARRSSPSRVICVHGSRDSTLALAESLREEGFDASAPKVGDTIDIE